MEQRLSQGWRWGSLPLRICFRQQGLGSFSLMFFVVFFNLSCFLSCWPEEQCMVLAAWDGEMLPVAAWGLDGHEWSWLTELNGFYWFLVFIAPRLYDLCLLLNRLSLDGPGFWIQVAAVLELLTLCNRLRLCLVVSHPLQCKFWWARERLGLLPWWLYGKEGLPHVASLPLPQVKPTLAAPPGSPSLDSGHVRTRGQNRKRTKTSCAVKNSLDSH